MNVVDIDFSPLKHYSLLFNVYRWLKRIRMIALRVGLLILLVLLFSYQDISWSYSDDGTIFSVLICVWLFVNFSLIIWMSVYWQRFADRNPGLTYKVPKTVKNPQALHQIDLSGPLPRMFVPSFRGKLLRLSLNPIVGELQGIPFGFFTRTYKEGGVVRWRERQMDTILWLELPKKLPNIIIDATANQRARRSNLSKRFDDSWKFQFEGAHGAHYNVYADPKDRIVALQLFTPDVLDVLYSHLPDIDVEIKDDTVWFVKRYGVLTDKLAKDIFSAIEQLLPELMKQIRSTLIQ